MSFIVLASNNKPRPIEKRVKITPQLLMS